MNFSMSNIGRILLKFSPDKFDPTIGQVNKSNRVEMVNVVIASYII